MDTLPFTAPRRGMSQDGISPGMPTGGGSASLAASLGTRFSVASHMSASSYFTEDYGRLEVMDDEELKQLVEDLKEVNHIMELENEVMVRYLIRNAEYDEVTLRQVIDRVAERAWRVIRMGPNQAQARGSNSSSNIMLNTGRSASRATLDSNGERRGNASVTSTHMRSKENSIAKLASPTLISGRRPSLSPSIMSTTAGGGGPLNFDRPGQRLNLAGKLEMLSRELADGKRELDRLEAYFGHRSVVLRVRIETATTMTEELDREREAFERDVVVGGVDPMTGRVPAERFVRHVAEWIRGMTQLGEKLRLRTSTLFSQLRRVQAQLAAKAELGETLTPVDFEQLHIDNKRFLATIEQKNLQVIELKRMAGDCALQLSVHKKALLADRAIEEFLRTIGDERQRQCDFMDQERSAVEDQIDRLQNRLDSLHTLTTNFMAPSVIDYARLRAKVAEQQHQYRIWKRRVDLQESALLVAASNMRSSKAAERRQQTELTEYQKDEAKRFCDFWFGGGAAARGQQPPGMGLDEGKEEGKEEKEKDQQPDSEDSWVDMPDHFAPMPTVGRQTCDEYLKALEDLRKQGVEEAKGRLLPPGVGPVGAAPWGHPPLTPLMEIPGEDFEDDWYPPGNQDYEDQYYQDPYYQDQPGEWGGEDFQPAAPTSSQKEPQDKMEQPSTEDAAHEGEGPLEAEAGRLPAEEDEAEEEEAEEDETEEEEGEEEEGEEEEGEEEEGEEEDDEEASGKAAPPPDEKGDASEEEKGLDEAGGGEDDAAAPPEDEEGDAEGGQPSDYD